jgi:hypothetical protein
MEKGYNIELLEETKNDDGYLQVIRISIEGGIGSIILENRGREGGLCFYREGDKPSDDSLFKKVN